MKIEIKQILQIENFFFDIIAVLKKEKLSY